MVRLRHIFRQGAESLIVVNAHRVNEGLMPELPPEGSKADFFFIERKEPEEIAATLKALVRQHIPHKFGLDPVDDIQVLTPMQRGLLGVANVNAELQALLNPSGDVAVRGSRTFRIGDKVMQIRNNYDLNVFNGDIGRVRAIDPVEQEVQVEFDGRAVTYDYCGPRRAGARLRLLDPQVAGQRVPVRRHPGAHAALHDAPAEPALHGAHAREAARHPCREQAGARHRGEEQLDRGALHDARGEAPSGRRSAGRWDP